MFKCATKDATSCKCSLSKVAMAKQWTHPPLHLWYGPWAKYCYFAWTMWSKWPFCGIILWQLRRIHFFVLLIHLAMLRNSQYTYVYIYTYIHIYIYIHIVAPPKKMSNSVTACHQDGNSMIFISYFQMSNFSIYDLWWLYTLICILGGSSQLVREFTPRSGHCPYKTPMTINGLV